MHEQKSQNVMPRPTPPDTHETKEPPIDKPNLFPDNSSLKIKQPMEVERAVHDLKNKHLKKLLNNPQGSLKKFLKQTKNM